MTSTYTTNKSYLEEPANGDYPNTWATPLNNNAVAIDNALGGTTSIDVSSADYTLLRAEAQALKIAITGTLTTNRNVTLPTGVGGFWIIGNGTSGNYTVTVKCSGAGTVVVAQGYYTLVYCDGSSVVLADSGPWMAKSGGAFSGGVALPSNGLTVGGSQLVVSGGNVSTSGSFYASGDITAFSDVRLKEAIEPITDALKLIEKMRGVYYRRKVDGAECVGLIAQEVEDVVPEVVSTQCGYLSVAYGNLVAVLIEAVKELSDRVRNLESQK